jgi:WD40 repeat protein
MKLKNEQQAIFTRRLLIGLAIGLLIVVIFQIILFMNQADSQVALQLTIEAQQTQVAALIPTQTYTPSRTSSPTASRTPTMTFTPRPTSTLTFTPTVTTTPSLTPTPNTSYRLYTIAYSTILLSVDWQPSGNYIAFGSFDTGNIIVYDVVEREEIRQLEGLTIAVSAIRWSPDTRFLAAADLDGHILVWDTETWELVHDFSGDGAILSISWSANGRYFAALELNNVNLWETATWTLALSDTSSYLSSPSDEIALAPDASQLAYMPFLETSLRIATLDEELSFVEKEIVFEFEDFEKFISVSWSSDGRLLVGGTDSGAIYIFDMSDNSVLETFNVHTDKITDARWSNDSRYLASASEDDTVIIWDTQSWEAIITLEFSFSSGREEIAGIAWSPDNCLMAVETSEIEIWALPELCEQE